MMRKLLIFVMFLPLVLLAKVPVTHNQTLLQQAENDSLALSRKMDRLALDFKILGQFDSARHYYTLAFEVKKNILEKNDTIIGHALNKIGKVHGLQGSYGQEQAFLEQAANVFISNLGPEHSAVATVFNNLAISFKNSGDFEKQHLYLERALAIRRSFFGNSHLTIAESYHNLSTYFFSQNEMEKFIAYANRSIEINRRILGDSHIKIASNYHNLAAGYERNREYEKAISYYTKSIEIKELNNDDPSSIANGYNSMANCYGKWGNKTKQGELLELALRIRIDGLGKRNVKVAFSHSNFGKFYYLQGQFDKALEQFQEGLVAVSSDFEGTEMSSNPTLETVRAKLQFFDLLRSKGKALENLHNQSKQTATLKAAYETFKVAVIVADEIRSDFSSEAAQARITTQAMAAYEGIINAAIQLNTLEGDDTYLHEAMEYSERSKVYTLRQLVFTSQSRQFGHIPDESILAELDLKRELHTIENQYASLVDSKDSLEIAYLAKGLFEKNSAYNKLLRQLEKEYPKYYELKFSQRVASVEEIRSDILTKESMLVEFFDGKNHLYRFVISRDEFRIDKLPKPKEFRALLSSFGKATTDDKYILSNPQESYGDYTKTGFELYNLLLAEALEKNNGSLSRLIIIPDGELAQINFEALLTDQTQSEATPDYRKLPYLINQYTTNYAYSATMLTESRAHMKNPSNSFGGFAPIYNRNHASNDSTNHQMLAQLARDNKLALPGAQEEVAQISDLLNGEAWVGEKATEANFKAQANQYRIIHLAMHGLLNDADPMNSELVFTKGIDSNEDGYLSIREIYNLDLNADLVVLSACDTGTGKLKKGEGAISLARAFSYAGSASIIMSLWKVPDENTKEIMIGLYKSLSARSKKGAALRNAKMDYITRVEDPFHAHPYYWAGFILTGDDTQVYGQRTSLTNWLIGFVIVLILLLGIKAYKPFRVSPTFRN